MKTPADFTNILRVLPESKKQFFLDDVSLAIKDGELNALKNDYDILRALANSKNKSPDKIEEQKTPQIKR